MTIAVEPLVGEVVEEVPRLPVGEMYEQVESLTDTQTYMHFTHNTKDTILKCLENSTYT